MHDGDGAWREYVPAKVESDRTKVSEPISLVRALFAEKGGETHQQRHAPGASRLPVVVVNVHHDLPNVVQGAGSADPVFADNQPFWKELERHSDRVCVVCSANMLRREGAVLSRRLSWEQTLEDLASELRRFDKLRGLARFAHVIVRFGVTGAAHIMTSRDGHRTIDLVFAPLARGGVFRDPNEDGKIEKASLPTRSQLNMHVDADEFMIRMYRGRFRPEAPGGTHGIPTRHANETTSPGTSSGHGNPTLELGAPQTPDQFRPPGGAPPGSPGADSSQDISPDHKQEDSPPSEPLP